ncbi:MAG TPA: SIS domain-containing protein [Ilumatobacteraceae bacterium]|jgi:D-sedoheptulose 7-phosphate isomerase
MSDAIPFDATQFLYPFIAPSSARSTPENAALLRDLSESAVAKMRASATLRETSTARCRQAVDAAAAAMAARFERGGRLFVFGNGGSSTDAECVASLFTGPPWGHPLPARALVDDSAVLTAISNDVSFDLVFSRQLIAHGKAGDIALGLSTSGNSRNLLTAFEEASARQMLTIGIAGYSGGEMSRSPHVQHCLVVDADSVHRIQETQAALSYALWSAVQGRDTRLGWR